MAKINLLELEVSQLIAAGEVVERPSSVIKELLENAIDAGATIITVEIKQGGITYMRITDNGCGIAPEDARTAFLRHATSKVRTEGDLEQITSLGFRGEALASVASVAKVELITREEGRPAGVRYELHGGEEIDFSEAGCPVGTTLVVRDLFYNTPARMKFLKKDASEAGAVGAVVDRIALSHPEIAVKFIRDGEVRLTAPGDGRLLSAIGAVFGESFASTLMEVDYTDESLSVKGYVSRPFHARASRSMQNFFINGRFVKSRTCMAALEEGFKGAIMVGKFPACVLNLSMPHDAVDVNVHPAKIEVRFSDEKKIFSALYFAVKNTLLRLDVTKKQDTAANTVRAPQDTAFPAREFARTGAVSNQPQAFAPASTAAKPEAKTVHSHAHLTDVKQKTITPIKPTDWDMLVVRDRDVDDAYVTQSMEIVQKPSAAPQSRLESFFSPEPTQQSMEKTERFSDAILVGELFGTYILLQLEDSIVIVDKHAAHERLIYEELTAGLGNLERQVLLSAVSVTLPKEEYAAALENTAIFERMGFLIEDFGHSSIIVREAPLILAHCNIADLVCEMANKLSRPLKNPAPDALDELLCFVACKSAIRAHDKTDPIELQRLIRLLRENEQVNFCPHGRPIATVMTEYELQKLFGRV